MVSVMKNFSLGVILLTLQCFETNWNMAHLGSDFISLNSPCLCSACKRWPFLYCQPTDLSLNPNAQQRSVLLMSTDDPSVNFNAMKRSPFAIQC